MSLDYDLTGIKDWKKVCWVDFSEAEGGVPESSKVMNPITHTLIFNCMSVGIGKITEENWREYYARSVVVGKIYSPPIPERNDKGEWCHRNFTPEEIKAHIGLRTNVSYEEEVVWAHRLVKGRLQDAKWDLRETKESQEVVE